MRPFDVIIVAHGTLASAMIEAAQMICGEASMQGVRAVGLAPDDSPEALRERLERAVLPGRPTLILTDLYGGTPDNVARTLVRHTDGLIRCVSGTNLGLLIEVLTSDEPLDDGVVERLATAAREAVVDVVGNRQGLLT